MAQTNIQIPEPALSRFLFADSRFAWFWLIVRVYVGWQWLHAGWQKVGAAAWTGDQAGTALRGFLNGALAKTSGPHPDVSGWYGSLIQNVGLPNASLISHIIAYGEVVIGVLLILGLFAGIAAFFGTTMNLNFLFAGTVSINPLLVVLQLFIILAWRIAGWYGLDRFALPILGTPWQPGAFFNRNS